MPRPVSSLVLAALLSAAVAVTGCGGDDAGGAGPAPTAFTAPPEPSTPEALGAAAEKLIAPRLGSTLAAWVARYTDADGRQPTLTWKGKRLADGSWQASLVLAPQGEAPRKAIWTALSAPGTEAASDQLSYVARPRNAEARRLARLPLASPARSGPIKLVVRIVSPAEAKVSGFGAKLVGPENASVSAMAVDADGRLDQDLLRGFALLGVPPYAKVEVALAKSTRFVVDERPRTAAEFLEAVGRLDPAYVALTFEDDPRRPRSVDELLFRPPTEVRLLGGVKD